MSIHNCAYWIVGVSGCDYGGLAECSAGDQMALDVEEVVDGRMDGEEPLRGRGRFEPLHLSLSSSHRLM